MKGTLHKVTKTEIREKFVGEEYPIHIFGRNIEVSESMRSYALEKLMKMERYGVRIIDAHIVMDIQRGINMVDILLHLNNTRILVSGREREMYASIDKAITRLKSKLSRYHRELHDYNQTKIGYAIHPGETGIKPLEDINDQIEEETLHQIEKELAPHPISKKEKLPVKILTEQEAIWKMENSIEPCLMFRGEEDKKLKVIYRQHDGSYGIMEPEE